MSQAGQAASQDAAAQVAAEVQALLAQAEECRRQAQRTCSLEAIQQLEQLADEYEAKARLLRTRGS